MYASSATTVCAALQLHGLPEESLQHRPARLRVVPVAGDAGQILEQLRAGGDRRVRRRAAAEPGLEVGRLHRDDPADHPRVLRAAVLGAEQVVASRLRRREPQSL